MYVQKNLKRRQTFANCFRFFHFQMVQAIQVLRFHLLELEKVSSGFLPDMRSSALCSKMGKISTFKLARLLQRLKSLDFVVIHAYIPLIALTFSPPNFRA